MVHLTRNFSGQAPLSPRLQATLAAAFDNGWADPKKVSQAGNRAAILRNQALEELAEHLAISPDQIEPLGEPSLGHYLALAGITSPSVTLSFSSIDLGKIRAVARAHQGQTHQIDVGADGIYRNIEKVPAGVVSLQTVNGETGIAQDLERVIATLDGRALISLDATHAIPQPGLTDGATSALLSATSWSNFTGIGFLIVGDRSRYKYPLPHIAPISVPGSYSLPLLIASVVALNEFKSSIGHIKSLRKHLVTALRTLSNVSVVEADTDSSSRYISILIDGFAAEEIMQRLAQFDIAIDAGSACSPEDLTPSHVIAAMGLPTTGHMRITLHPHHTTDDIDLLVNSMKEVLQ